MTKNQFNTLNALLEKDRGLMHNPLAFFKHPAHLQIMAFGEEAVPHILERLTLDAGISYWMSSLEKLTGNKIRLPGKGPNEHRDAWVKWGKKKGYLPK